MHRRQFIKAFAGLVVTGLFRDEARAGTKHIVIAGGGIIGASIAYHLAQRGAQVTLCEKLRPASGATEKSFAWINGGKQPRPYFDLALLGMSGWRRLHSELWSELKIQWGGSLTWYPPGEGAEQLHRDVRRIQGWGYATHLVDEPEFHRLLPNVVPGPLAAASYSEQEGTLDPAHAVRVLLKEAGELGARVLYPCEVTGLDIASGGVRGVQTTKGRFEADVLVLACGVDTPRVAAMAEVNVPLKDSPGVLAHTAPQPRLIHRIALAPGAHIKQGPDGQIVTGSDFGGSPVTETSKAYGQQLLREAARFLPQLDHVPVEHVTLGWRVVPKDGFPIVGFADRCRNLYVAVMHSGITLAPVIGQFAAWEILDGARIDLLQQYRPSRFDFDGFFIAP